MIWLARIAKSFVRNPNCAVLLQDWAVTRSYIRPEELQNVVMYGDEVYWQIADPNLSDLEILEVIESPPPWPMCAYFHNAKPNRPGSQLGDEDLTRIASSIVGVAVGAFDDRSFLLWWRTELQPFPLAQ